MSAFYIISQSSNGQYHFVLKAPNGEVILSSEMYNSVGAADAVGDVFIQLVGNARFPQFLRGMP